jgi:hypothetical protein
MAGPGHSEAAAHIYQLAKTIKPTKYIEALTVSTSTPVTIDFSNSASGLGVHQVVFQNTGSYPAYWTISTSSEAVSASTAATNLAASASSGISSRGYLPVGGTIELAMSDRILALYFLSIGTATDIRGFTAEA